MPFQIGSFILPNAAFSGTRLPEKPFLQFSRYYLHNEGAAPEMNQPISVFIERGGERGIERTRREKSEEAVVNVANRSGVTAEGTLRIYFSDGTHLAHTPMKLRLGPKETVSFPITLESPSGPVDMVVDPNGVQGRKRGTITAVFETETLRVYDVLPPPDRELISVASWYDPTDRCVNVSLADPEEYPTRVRIQIAFPMECWHLPFFDRYVEFGSEGKGKSLTLKFPLGLSPPSFWGVVKVMYEGFVSYSVVEGAFTRGSKHFSTPLLSSPFSSFFLSPPDFSSSAPIWHMPYRVFRGGGGSDERDDGISPPLKEVPSGAPYVYMGPH